MYKVVCSEKFLFSKYFEFYIVYGDDGMEFKFSYSFLASVNYHVGAPKLYDGDYLDIFITYGKFNKVLSGTCEIFVNRYPKK